MKTPVVPLLFVALLSCLLVEISTEEYLVTLNHGGEVRGSTVQSQNGRTIYAFRAIPYAEPPVGELRFKKPVPKAAWKDQPIDGTADGPMCVQFYQSESVPGQEDCLNLNVYTPKLPEDGSHETKMAVMVFIHGGSFSVGSSAMSMYGPARLLDEDVVLVTMNYRLGPLGFLSTGDKASPGNYGLMDQLLALQWVKEHIEVFGGNAKQVTLFGESSGAASVGFHLVSPLSAGLFHAAIAQSGSPLSLDSIQENPMYWAKRLAADLECSNQDSAEMVECLRQIPIAQIFQFPIHYANYSAFPPTFVPTIDGSFLTKEPRKVIKCGEANRVPYLGGLNKDEGLVVYADLYLKANNNMSDLEHVVEELFKYGLDYEGRADDATKLIMNEYFSRVNWADRDSTRQAIAKAASDFMFNVPHYEMMNLLAKNGFKVYTYSLDYMPSVGFLQLFGIKEKWGVSHADELGLLFDGILLPNPTTDDLKIIKVFRSAWTSFAKYGQPTPNTARKSVLKWKPSTFGQMKVYHIDNPVMTSTYKTNNDRRYRFYTEVIAQLLSKPACRSRFRI